MSKFFRLTYFIRDPEVVGSIFLALSTTFTLILSNSRLADTYYKVLYTPFPLLLNSIGPFNMTQLVNEGLMVGFFLLISLEIKREFLMGCFQNWRYAILPFMAALGGVIVPATFYIILNWQHPETIQGWAIPTATDIAFSLGVLSLAGKKVPSPLKLLLSTLAIIDDCFAIFIIAIFYTSHLVWTWCGVGLILLAVLWGLNIRRIQYLSLYLLIGVLLWLAFLKSGIHTSVAGVLLGSTIPLYPNQWLEKYSLLHRLETQLRPWVNYGILPLFAIANTGVTFGSFDKIAFLHPIFLGVFVGLLIGKPVGILLGSGLALKSGFARLPSEISRTHILAMSLLGGIGLTMSLFLGILAFPELLFLQHVRQAILTASFLSASTALLVLCYR